MYIPYINSKTGWHAWQAEESIPYHFHSVIGFDIVHKLEFLKQKELKELAIAFISQSINIDYQFPLFELVLNIIRAWNA